MFITYNIQAFRPLSLYGALFVASHSEVSTAPVAQLGFEQENSTSKS